MVNKPNDFKACISTDKDTYSINEEITFKNCSKFNERRKAYCGIKIYNHEKVNFRNPVLGLIGFGVVGCKKDNVFPNSLQNSKNEFNVSTDG